MFKVNNDANIINPQDIITRPNRFLFGKPLLDCFIQHFLIQYFQVQILLYNFAPNLSKAKIQQAELAQLVEQFIRNE